MKRVGTGLLALFLWILFSTSRNKLNVVSATVRLWPVVLAMKPD